MEAPAQIDARQPGDYLEVMSMAVFQSGISWQVVRSKWPGIREAFHGFDATAVADMTEADIDRLAADTRVIRNRRKLAAIVENANTLPDLDEKHGAFATTSAPTATSSPRLKRYAGTSNSSATPAATSSSTSSARKCPTGETGGARGARRSRPALARGWLAELAGYSSATFA